MAIEAPPPAESRREGVSCSAPSLVRDQLFPPRPSRRARSRRYRPCIQRFWVSPSFRYGGYGITAKFTHCFNQLWYRLSLHAHITLMWHPEFEQERGNSRLLPPFLKIARGSPGRNVLRGRRPPDLKVYLKTIRETVAGLLLRRYESCEFSR